MLQINSNNYSVGIEVKDTRTIESLVSDLCINGYWVKFEHKDEKVILWIKEVKDNE